MALEINEKNVDETLESKKVTVLDFWAEWCGPCRVLGPIIDDLANDNLDKDVSIGKVNVDGSRDLAIKYGVRGITTVIIFKDGKEESRNVGIMSKDSYQKIVNDLL